MRDKNFDRYWPFDGCLPEFSRTEVHNSTVVSFSDSSREVYLKPEKSVKVFLTVTQGSHLSLSTQGAKFEPEIKIWIKIPFDPLTLPNLARAVTYGWLGSYWKFISIKISMIVPASLQTEREIRKIRYQLLPWISYL